MSTTGLVPKIKDGDWVSVRQAIAKLSTKLGPISEPTYAGLTLTGLTASRLVATDANKKLESSDLASWVTQTTNQVIVTDDADGTITLSTPQNIHISADVAFNTLFLSSSLQVDGPILGDSETGDVLIRLGDAAGTDTLSIEDSNSSEQAYIDSDGGFWSSVWNTHTGGVIYVDNNGELDADHDLFDWDGTRLLTGKIQTSGDIGVLGDTDLLQLAANSLTINGALTTTGAIYVTTYLYHINDTDTGIVFGTDTFYFQAGNLQFIKMFETSDQKLVTEFIVNDNGVDINTRIEGTGNANLLFVDAGNNRVAIGFDTPSVLFSVNGVSRFGDDTTNYSGFSATGNQTFVGSAGFYPRFLTQSVKPVAGTGATQCDTSEMVMWKDSDDNKVYLCFNDGGTIKTVELT